MQYKSLSLTSHVDIPNHISVYHILFWAGLAYQLLALFNLDLLTPEWGGPVSLMALFGGLTGAALKTEKARERKHQPIYLAAKPRRGRWQLAAALLLTLFYIALYLQPEWLGLSTGDGVNAGMIGLYDSISFAINGKKASQWFVYGVLYTLIILSLGIKFIYKFRHNRYQVFRTISIMFFQLCFAFILPQIMESLNKPAVDFKNFWPLQYYFYFDWNVSSLIESGRFGIIVLIWGTLGFLVITPILTYFYGKRWYCSWVCGCGGLAETAGDPLRSLSDKSKQAWKWERAVIYSVLALIVITTLLILLSRYIEVLSGISQTLAHYYGLFIGAIFSGIIGVGFYPLFGARIWCRFGCPMAAYLGIWQKYFSKFRITTNHGQCISCGNCSTHCEMGIDVKSYAQKGEDIKRASCVGCGICSAVCPRGVLRLENK